MYTTVGVHFWTRLGHISLATTNKKSSLRELIGCSSGFLTGNNFLLSLNLFCNPFYCNGKNNSSMK
jgi:hypothetical protein